MEVVHHTGEHHLVLAREPDRGHPHQRILQFVLDRLFGFPAALAPQVTGVAQFGLLVLEKEIDRLG